LLAAEIRQVGEPKPLHDLHIMTPGDLRDLVEPMVDRIGPDTVRYLLELCQIRIDLARINGNIGAKRILVVPKGRIGNAGKLFGGRERAWRHIDRGPKPGPEGEDQTCSNPKGRGR